MFCVMEQMGKKLIILLGLFVLSFSSWGDTLKVSRPLPVQIDTLKISPMDSLMISSADSLKVLSTDSLMISSTDTLKVSSVDSLKVLPVDSLKVLPKDTLKVISDTLAVPVVDTVMVSSCCDSLTLAPCDSLQLVPCDSLQLAPCDSLKLLPCDSTCLAQVNSVMVPTDTVRRTRTIFALKTNLLYDLATVVNYSLEVPIGNRVSLLVQHYIPWWRTKDNKYCLELQSLGAEARFWFNPHEEKRLSGHFLGAYGFSGTTDLQYDRELDIQAKFWSAGLTYGYSFILNNSLRLELSISGGYLRAPIVNYIPSDDYSILFRDLDKPEQIFNWWGPTKIEVSFVWSINAPYRKNN